jgi:hypothetical protein
MEHTHVHLAIFTARLASPHLNRACRALTLKLHVRRHYCGLLLLLDAQAGSSRVPGARHSSSCA